MPTPAADASDWSDLDLLTVAEATGRLDEEIAALRGDDSPPARERLQLLVQARARALIGTQVVRPGPVRTAAQIAATPGPPDEPPR